MFKNFNWKHGMGVALISVALFGVGARVMKGGSTAPSDRFTEPIRSQLYMQGLFGGMPVTLIECLEEQLIKQGIKHPKQISRDAMEKAQNECKKTVIPKLQKEIEEALAAEEQARSI